MRWSLSIVWLVAFAGTARADVRPYITLHDDGTFLAFTVNSISATSKAFMRLYDATGAPRPNVISVWSDFPLGGESIGTIFLPQRNSVQGIGFNAIYGGKGTFGSDYGPVNAILLHNSVLDLPQRIALVRANSDPIGFAQYLFLLEFSHQWLSAALVPGSNANDLGVYPHWSFWYSSGDSPPGGNAWTDNGDGTFSTIPVDPDQVKYSSLDLYLMGLVDAGAVEPFSVLEDVVAPPTPTDPYSGGRFAASSLTDFDASPLTVKATSKSYTVSDIITANGPRIPASSPNNYTLGIVLMVSQDAGSDQIAADQAIFDPISVTLAPAFAQATRGIASLTVITDGGELADDAGPDGGPEAPDAGATEIADSGTSPALKSSGCGTGLGGGTLGSWLALVAWVARRKRNHRACASAPW